MLHFTGNLQITKKNMLVWALDLFMLRGLGWYFMGKGSSRLLTFSQLHSPGCLAFFAKKRNGRASPGCDLQVFELSKSQVLLVKSLSRGSTPRLLFLASETWWYLALYARILTFTRWESNSLLWKMGPWTSMIDQKMLEKPSSLTLSIPILSQQKHTKNHIFSGPSIPMKVVPKLQFSRPWGRRPWPAALCQ